MLTWGSSRFIVKERLSSNYSLFSHLDFIVTDPSNGGPPPIQQVELLIGKSTVVPLCQVDLCTGWTDKICYYPAMLICSIHHEICLFAHGMCQLIQVLMISIWTCSTLTWGLNSRVKDSDMGHADRDL